MLIEIADPGAQLAAAHARIRAVRARLDVPAAQRAPIERAALPRVGACWCDVCGRRLRVPGTVAEVLLAGQRAGWVFGTPVGSEAPAYCDAHATDLPPAPLVVEPQPAATPDAAPAFELVTAPSADAANAEWPPLDITHDDGPEPDADEPAAIPAETTPAPAE